MRVGYIHMTELLMENLRWLVTLIGVVVAAAVNIWQTKRNISKSIEENKKNINILVERRYIDTISQQRIEWLNKLRDSFVEINQVIQRSIYIGVNDPELNKFYELNFELKKYGYQLELLINPLELSHKELLSFKRNIFRKIDEYHMKIISTYSKEVKNVGNIAQANKLLGRVQDDSREIEKLLYELIKVQQIILKSEWSRIKTEIELGKELDKREVEKIYLETSANIKKGYGNYKEESIFTVNFDILNSN